MKKRKIYSFNPIKLSMRIEVPEALIKFCEKEGLKVKNVIEELARIEAIPHIEEQEKEKNRLKREKLWAEKRAEKEKIQENKRIAWNEKLKDWEYKRKNKIKRGPGRPSDWEIAREEAIGREYNKRFKDMDDREKELIVNKFGENQPPDKVFIINTKAFDE